MRGSREEEKGETGLTSATAILWQTGTPAAPVKPPSFDFWIGAANVPVCEASKKLVFSSQAPPCLWQTRTSAAPFLESRKRPRLRSFEEAYLFFTSPSGSLADGDVCHSVSGEPQTSPFAKLRRSLSFLHKPLRAFGRRGRLPLLLSGLRGGQPLRNDRLGGQASQRR